MKHRRSSLSSACPAARVLWVVATLGSAACSGATAPADLGIGAAGTEGQGEPVGAGGASEVVGGGSAGTGLVQSSGGTSGVAAAGSGGGDSTVGAGGAGAVTPQGRSGGGSSSGGTAGAAGTAGSDDGTDSGAGGAVANGGSAGGDSVDTGGAGAGTSPQPPDDEDQELEPGAEQDQVATLAEGEFGALALAVGGGSIYVVDRSASTLARLPTAGGDIELISPTLELLPSRLAVDESSIYADVFLRPGHTELWRVPLEGGSFDAELGGVLLGEVSSLADMAATADSIVTLEQPLSPSKITRTISRADKAEGGVAPVASVGLTFSGVFAADDSSAYVATGFETSIDVVRVDLASGEASPAARLRTEEFPSDFSASDGVLYFASKLRVGRIPDAEGDAGAGTLADIPAYRLVASVDYVYFFSALNGGCEDGSKLYRVAVGGGAAEHVASEATPGCVSALAADADGVYWLTAGGSQLRSLPSP